MKSLFALPRRIREVKSEAELTEIENQVDGALDAEMANAIKSENAQDISTLVSLAHRLEDSIHRRRLAIAGRIPRRRESYPLGFPINFSCGAISGPD